MENWNNDACIGYAIKTLIELGNYTGVEINSVIKELDAQLCITTIKEAERFYHDWLAAIA